jgi:hypothetical protein
MPKHKKATGLGMSDTEILEAALIGLAVKRSEIEEKMTELRRQIGGGSDGRPSSTGVDSAPAVKKRTLSVSARKRIAAAQRKRWRELKNAQTEAAPVKKRKLSAAGRKRIIAATKKRWAEYKAKKAASA